MVEYFAGHGNLSKAMKLAGLRTASLDIEYRGWEKGKSYKSNAMDFTSASGFASFGCVDLRVSGLLSLDTGVQNINVNLGCYIRFHLLSSLLAIYHQVITFLSLCLVSGHGEYDTMHCENQKAIPFLSEYFPVNFIQKRTMRIYTWLLHSNTLFSPLGCSVSILQSITLKRETPTSATPNPSEGLTDACVLPVTGIYRTLNLAVYLLLWPVWFYNLIWLDVFMLCENRVLAPMSTDPSTTCVVEEPWYIEEPWFIYRGTLVYIEAIEEPWVVEAPCYIEEPFECPFLLSRPRLCLSLLFQTDKNFLATIALKCSSWTAVNQGTSGRAPCASLGNEMYPSVRAANCMGARILC